MFLLHNYSLSCTINFSFSVASFLLLQLCYNFSHLSDNPSCLSPPCPCHSSAPIHHRFTYLLSLHSPSAHILSLIFSDWNPATHTTEVAFAEVIHDPHLVKSNSSFTVLSALTSQKYSKQMNSFLKHFPLLLSETSLA